VCVCVGGGWEGEREREKGWAGIPNITVKNSTALGDKQHPRMLWEWQRREGRKEGRNAAAWRQEREDGERGGGELGCHLCLPSSLSLGS